jgi:hypothetical protein
MYLEVSKLILNVVIRGEASDGSCTDSVAVCDVILRKPLWVDNLCEETFNLLHTLEDGTDRLSRNFGKELPLLAV